MGRVCRARIRPSICRRLTPIPLSGEAIQARHKSGASARVGPSRRSVRIQLHKSRGSQAQRLARTPRPRFVSAHRATASTRLADAATPVHVDDNFILIAIVGAEAIVVLILATLAEPAGLHIIIVRSRLRRPPRSPFPSTVRTWRRPPARRRPPRLRTPSWSPSAQSFRESTSSCRHIAGTIDRPKGRMPSETSPRPPASPRARRVAVPPETRCHAVATTTWNQLERDGTRWTEPAAARGLRSRRVRFGNLRKHASRHRFLRSMLTRFESLRARQPRAARLSRPAGVGELISRASRAR